MCVWCECLSKVKTSDYFLEIDTGWPFIFRQKFTLDWGNFLIDQMTDGYRLPKRQPKLRGLLSRVCASQDLRNSSKSPRSKVNLSEQFDHRTFEWSSPLLYSDSWLYLKPRVVLIRTSCKCCPGPGSWKADLTFQTSWRVLFLGVAVGQVILVFEFSFCPRSATRD